MRINHNPIGSRCLLRRYLDPPGTHPSPTEPQKVTGAQTGQKSAPSPQSSGSADPSASQRRLDRAAEDRGDHAQVGMRLRPLVERERGPEVRRVSERERTDGQRATARHDIPPPGGGSKSDRSSLEARNQLIPYEVD